MKGVAYRTQLDTRTVVYCDTFDELVALLDWLKIQRSPQSGVAQRTVRSRVLALLQGDPNRRWTAREVRTTLGLTPKTGGAVALVLREAALDGRLRKVGSTYAWNGDRTSAPTPVKPGREPWSGDPGPADQDT